MIEIAFAVRGPSEPVPDAPKIAAAVYHRGAVLRQRIYAHRSAGPVEETCNVMKIAPRCAFAVFERSSN